MKRPKDERDDKPDKPGGKAAERRRQFEESRGLTEERELEPATDDDDEEESSKEDQS
jgi:hypothetical protein